MLVRSAWVVPVKSLSDGGRGMAAKIIRDDAQPIRRWELPAVEEKGVAEAESGAASEEPETAADGGGQPRLEPAPARDLDQELVSARKQGYEEGYRIGSEEGFQKGYEAGINEGLQRGKERAEQSESLIEIERQQLQARIQHFEQLLRALADPVSQVDKEVEDQLVELVLAVSRQLIRRELKADPGQIIAVVREAVSLLPVAAREYRLALHPEDAVLVREALAMDDREGDRPWTIVEDPTLTRGGCRVVSEASYIDATVERQLAAVAATLLGDERERGG